MTLRITVTIHSDGTFSVLVEWITSNPSTGIEMAYSPVLGIIVNKMAYTRKQIQYTHITCVTQTVKG